jgi:hypothetical protein
MGTVTKVNKDKAAVGATANENKPSTETKKE